MKKSGFSFGVDQRDAHLAGFSKKRNQFFFMASW